jgi:hypothetical protein
MKKKYIKQLTRKPFKSKIAYIRWGQAWMLKGLSNLSKTMN